MTNHRSRTRRSVAKYEAEIFNALSRPLRDALNNCADQPPKASIVRDALLRGVSEEKIIETIERSQRK